MLKLTTTPTSNSKQARKQAALSSIEQHCETLSAAHSSCTCKVLVRTWPTRTRTPMLPLHYGSTTTQLRRQQTEYSPRWIKNSRLLSKSRKPPSSAHKCKLLTEANTTQHWVSSAAEHWAQAKQLSKGQHSSSRLYTGALLGSKASTPTYTITTRAELATTCVLCFLYVYLLLVTWSTGLLCLLAVKLSSLEKQRWPLRPLRHRWCPLNPLWLVGVLGVGVLGAQLHLLRLHLLVPLVVTPCICFNGMNITHRSSGQFISTFYILRKYFIYYSRFY